MNQLCFNSLLNKEVIKHLNIIDLSTPISLKCGIPKLKTILYKEISSKRETYSIFIPSKLIDNITQGNIEFTEEISIILPLALCNALQIPVVVMTGMAFVPIIPLISYERILSFHLLYIVFDHSTGFYDGVKLSEIVPSPKNNETDTPPNQENKIVAINCRCGQGAKKKLSGIVSCDIYRSGCPCFKTVKGCTDKCKCIGCANPYGLVKNTDRVGTSSRKRRMHEISTKIPLSTSFYQSREEQELIDDKWSLLEEILLIELMKFFARNDIDDPLIIYNHFLSIQSSNLVACNYKTMPQLLKRINVLYKSDGVFQKLLLEQARLNF